jgi:hypothetical protein
MGLLLNIFSFIRDKLSLLKVLIIVNASISVAFLVITLSAEININYLFYPVQGLIIGPLLIFGYNQVYKMVSKYHD